MTPLTVQGRQPPGGMRQSPFCGATGASFSLAKCTFFFLRKKEIEIIRSCSSHWTLKEKAFLQDEMGLGAVLPQTGCARLLLHPPCGQKSSRLGRITQGCLDTYTVLESWINLPSRFHVKSVPSYSSSLKHIPGKITGILSFPLISASRLKERKDFKFPSSLPGRTASPP